MPDNSKRFEVWARSACGEDWEKAGVYDAETEDVAIQLAKQDAKYADHLDWSANSLAYLETAWRGKPTIPEEYAAYQKGEY